MSRNSRYIQVLMKYAYIYTYVWLSSSNPYGNWIISYPTRDLYYGNVPCFYKEHGNIVKPKACIRFPFLMYNQNYSTDSRLTGNVHYLTQCSLLKENKNADSCIITLHPNDFVWWVYVKGVRKNLFCSRAHWFLMGEAHQDQVYYFYILSLIRF